jgi:hypothetical protein
VQGSAGQDRIDLNGTVSANSKINGGADNDSITIETTVGEVTKGSTVNGNKGADTITINNAIVDEVTIFGGSGADIITNTVNQTTISGDKGDDVIKSGTGTKVSVSGGEGGDTITLEADAATETATANGGVGNDSIVLGGAGIATVMQGRTDSTAATAETGNAGSATAIVDGDIITYGNGIDVASATTLDDLFGLGLDTTEANYNFFGYQGTGVGAGASVNIKDGVAGASLTWGDLADNGRTTIMNGLLTNGTTFTIGDDETDDDMLVIMGDGTGTTANTSAFVIQGLNADLDGTFDTFGIENTNSFTTYKA